MNNIVTCVSAMTDERKTFCRITTLDQDYYLLAERAVNDDLKLALSDGSNVWNGLGESTDQVTYCSLPCQGPSYPVKIFA